ncbi:MAG: glycosyl transferase [Bryobacteraceae bacterium]|nr:glycosyl transferase [Bryobacteraceae bacterium]
MKQLRLTGSPAIFVLHPDLDHPTTPGETSGKPQTHRSSILTRLKEDQLILDASRSELLEAARLDHALPAAAEWIIDNVYLLRTQIAEVRRNLPRDYPKILPSRNPDFGHPRVYEIARELVSSAEFAVDSENIAAHLADSQKAKPLTVAELWFFPTLLRVALIEGLTQLVLQVNRAQQLREAAYLWANRLGAAARLDATALERALLLMENATYALQPYFVSSLVEQLQDEDSALTPVQRWVEDRLAIRLTELVRNEHSREATERLTTANAFESLRTLSRIDFTEIFEATSVVEAELRRDPGGVYTRSDFVTRDRCRRVVERLARRSKWEEVAVARRAVALAAAASDPRFGHVAYFLIDEGIAELEVDLQVALQFSTRVTRTVRQNAVPIYLGGITGLTACLLALSLAFAWEAGVRHEYLLAALGVLALFPLSEMSIQIVNALVISLLPPDPLPKMDFRKGVPPEEATLIVVPMMLTSVETIRSEIEKLEVRFIANQSSNVYFSLFSDFTDAEEPTDPNDAVLVETIKQGIDNLNTRYPGGRFLLFHRQREWSESEQFWIGRERKRGKIEDLNAYLAGEGSAEILLAGHLPLTIRYVITLDSDTQLPPGTGRRMIETIAHPLNRAEIDPVTRIRKRGFTVIQPRVSIALPGATVTRFTRVFADSMGIDPYCQWVSDAHQDLFGEAAFHGKAIYDVAAFRATVGGRFPAETILSHDLIEGAHAGVGLAADIELFENLPLDYVGYCKRAYRWIRGDWQIAPWILPQVPAPGGGSVPNPLSAINRWRILDNLRRSLVPVASLLLLLFGWLISAAPGVWSLVVGLAVVIPTLAPLLDRLARQLQGRVNRWHGASAEFVRALVGIAFLPHQAWLSVDAIVRVAYRRLVSRRRLLEWQTAETANSSVLEQIGPTFQQLLVISALSVLVMILQGIEGAFIPTGAFLSLWIISPALMRWLGQQAPKDARRALTRVDARYLRMLARRTWRYFDDLVGDESNWLPPDNSQLALRVEVAQRTSPTNIGLWLTSALAATDFGYLTIDDFLQRLERTVATLGKLEHYEGHLLNWYNTRTLEPLLPRYVSTVDSGNLLASYWVLKRGCEDLMRRPLISHACVTGVHDTLSILRDASGWDTLIATPIQELHHLLRRKVDGHHLLSRLSLSANAIQQLKDTNRWQDPSDERTYWVSRLTMELGSRKQTIEKYLRWMQTLTLPPDSFVESLGDDAVKLRRKALRSIPSLLDFASGGPPSLQAVLALRERQGLRPEARGWLDQVAAEFAESQKQAAETAGRLHTLGAAFEDFGAAINMGFLYDRSRKLFGVGYAIGGPAVFTSHYDLLASECRLASFVAIAKGDVPVDHWFALARPRVLVPDGRQALLSWSGTMFEYLMPLIFMRTYDNSLLDMACREAVRQQISYGRENGLPWGASESAFSALDANQVYQYRAFGVPVLALKPALEGHQVIAPYATVLALLVDPVQAIVNLRKLEDHQMAGAMGFYESIDFSIEKQEGGDRGVPVYTYMAHHQGMSLTALDDVLHNEVMRHRFHGDVRIRAMEVLLFECTPITYPPAEELGTGPAPIKALTKDPAERIWPEETAVPRVNIQGNGRYAIMLTNSGGGYSHWYGFDVTRWRSDATIDSWGSYIYIRDVRSGETWAASYQPLAEEAGESSVRFAPDRAEFQRRCLGIETLLAVTVAPDDDVELRRLTVTNRSMRSRELELTSYAELAMAPHRWDTSHPAFAKLFVQTEWQADGVLIAHRRPRNPEDAEIWTAHFLVGPSQDLQFETDRSGFLGRAHTPAAPDALNARLSGSVGTVLDPIFSLRCRATLEPRDRREITFITAAAASREALATLIENFRRPETVGRAFEMAWTRAQLEFRYLGIGPAVAHRYQELAGHMLFPSAALRPPSDRLMKNRLGQTVLWKYGISGDMPMLTVTIYSERQLMIVRELLTAHTYWRLRGFHADLVILNQESPSYDLPLHQQLVRLIEAHSAETGLDRPGGVFLRDGHSIPEEHRNCILAASSVVLSGARGPLHQQLAAPGEKPSAPFFVPPGGEEEPSAPLPFLELPYFNGLGGFTADGREYAIYLTAGCNTPAPWANVLANPEFGCVVTESGLGFTWCGNSQSNRLTPWHNDPVSDPQSEAIYIRDDETGTVWTPTPLPIREQDAYRARHGQGSTVFEHNSHSIEQELTVFVPMSDDDGDPVKVCRLRLRNGSTRTRHLTITYFAELVLGTAPDEMERHVRTQFDEESGALLATQTWMGDSAGGVAFAASSPRAATHSGDRTQLLGRDGSTAKPGALGRSRLDNRTGAGVDPAAALQLTLTLLPGEQNEAVFLLGEVGTVEQVRALVARYQKGSGVEAALVQTREWWDTKLSVVQVHTPQLSTDFLLNRWLPYQTLCCRFWARSATYQSSGAFGFRDQLQDAMALVYAFPELTRRHILTAAARQFLEGDVQHWWHPDSGAGVRTRCSDDLVWLPYVVAHYVRVTGDTTILDAEAPFLEGEDLPPGEQERFSTPHVSTQTASVWEHCVRALERSWRLGPHGLPLFGSGDWNDGMNRVGIEGRGESVWLAWFLCDVLHSFARLGESRESAGDSIATWRRRAASLSDAVEGSCWDGEWYLRGFFDNGAPLGSHTNSEARIDSIAQSWAVISGAADPERAALAMQSADRLLLDEQNRIMRLFTPPFDHSTPHPGYIMGYPPGIRENGGQYTHGALWMASGWARLGRGDRAVRLLTLLSPVESSVNPKMVARYRGEPYVAAADVYSSPDHPGQAGWTWYTGSAGWMYRIWLEEVLGFKLSGDTLQIAPVIPMQWDGFEIRYRYRSTQYTISIKRQAMGESLIELDGQPLPGGLIHLTDDGGTHLITIRLDGEAAGAARGLNDQPSEARQSVASLSGAPGSKH